MSAPIQSYQPEKWTLLKDDVYAAILCLETGLQNTKGMLTIHDGMLGRELRQNRIWAEQLEEDIRRMTQILERLRAYSPITFPGSPKP